MPPTTRPPRRDDLAPDYWLKQRRCQDRLADLLGRHGYQLLDTPILEPTELFLRKSGGALASQMYSFTDPGGQPVSLRPEFTAPIMRYYLEHAGSLPLPARFQYAGPVFRYEQGANRPGQFTQVGAELIGASGVAADAELLALAARLPAELGIGDVRLELADVSVPHSLLDALGLSERARSFVLGQMPALRGKDRGPAAVKDALARAQELNLTRSSSDWGKDDGLAAAIAGLDDDQARQVLRGLFQWQGEEETTPSRGTTPPFDKLRAGSNLPLVRGGTSPLPLTKGETQRGSSPRPRATTEGSSPSSAGRAKGDLGRRHPDEVVERLLRKLRGSDTPDQLARGLELVAKLAALRGEPLKVVDQAAAVLSQAGAGADSLGRLGELVTLLQAQPELRGRLVVDFGLVRELAYYNGLVFQATHPAGRGRASPALASTAPTPLGGGGRYDGLSRALGGPGQVAVPALGFAYTLEALMELMP
jgi:histidyl-tRNA synthetase